jgi:hypothetical protein
VRNWLRSSGSGGQTGRESFEDGEPIYKKITDRHEIGLKNRLAFKQNRLISHCDEKIIPVIQINI